MSLNKLNLETNGLVVGNTQLVASGGNITVGQNLSVKGTGSSTSGVTGALTVAGGLGVTNNIYTGGRIGWSNSANTSVVYQIYNSTTNSLDTYFA
jgi:hypothetical protein